MPDSRSIARIAWFSVSGHVQGRAGARHALRLLKRGEFGRPIEQRWLAAAEPAADLAIEVRLSNLMVIAIRDVQRVVAGQHFARKAQCVCGFGNPFQGNGGRAGIEHPAGFEVLQHPLDQRIELRKRQLPLVLADDAALGVDEDQGWPGATAEALPHLEVTIVDDRMLDPVAQHRLAQVGGFALGGELWRVDPDDDHLVAVLPLDLPQLRKGVHAVDSAEGPEVEDRQPPTQVGDVKGSGDVEPVEPIREIGSSDQPGQGGNRHAINGRSGVLDIRALQ